MAMTNADRVRFRELTYAYDRSSAVRAAHPGAETVMLAGKQSADVLRDEVSAVLAEQADDAPARRERDRAAVALRKVGVAALQRHRATVALRATDASTGEVTNPAEIDAAQALEDTYLRGGNLGGLAPDGPALHLQASQIRDALSPYPESAGLVAALGEHLAAHERARTKVTTEATELDAARSALAAARERADRMRRAGWHFLSFLAAFEDPSIDVAAIYPVSSRTRAVDDDAANEALDDLGVPEPEAPIEVPAVEAEAPSAP